MITVNAMGNSSPELVRNEEVNDLLTYGFGSLSNEIALRDLGLVKYDRNALIAVRASNRIRKQYNQKCWDTHHDTNNTRNQQRMRIDAVAVRSKYNCDHHQAKKEPGGRHANAGNSVPIGWER
jgi:hypothetical protein